MRRRVVVTGLGVVSPIGEGQAAFWEALNSGRTGISEVGAFDTTQFASHRGAEVKGFDPARHVKDLAAAPGRTAQLAIAAARLAVAHAGLEPSRMPRGSCGVGVGTTMGEQRILEDSVRSALEGEAAEPAVPFTAYAHDQLATRVMAELEIEAGPHMVFANACASGNYAIGWAYDQIALGRAEAMLAGGAEAFSRIAFTGFSRLGAIAPEMCQPFDAQRKGAIFGEGAAMLVLEWEESARARGAEPLAELAGYALTCDAFHLTAPHPEGAGALSVMRRALRHAGVSPDQVSLVNAHGTGTVANDRSESRAIRALFGEDGGRVPVTSIKSSIGHTMGAASAIEAAASVLSIHTGVLPPTVHHYETDPQCGVEVVAREARPARVSVVLNNAFGFGGNNAATVFRRAS